MLSGRLSLHQERCLTSGACTQVELAEHFTKRTVVVIYRGVELKMQVVSLREEVELKVSAALKELAVNRANGIVPLLVEEIVFEDKPLEQLCVVSPKLLGGL